MAEFDQWLKDGVSWKEVSVNNGDVKPKNSIIVYIIRPSQDDPIKVERTTRDPNGKNTERLEISDLISEGMIFDTDPELQQTVDLKGDEYLVEKFETLQLETGPRECFKLIFKKDGACELCSGVGNCVVCMGSNACDICDKSGKCNNCDGTGTCTYCEGSGTCYYCEGDRSCHSCNGTGKGSDEETCSECNGSGKCTICDGDASCPNCKGSKRCVDCSGSGKCFRCDGTGTCGFCKGTSRCRVCEGNCVAHYETGYWFDKATGLRLRYLKSVNGRPIIEITMKAITPQSGVVNLSSQPSRYQQSQTFVMSTVPKQSMTTKLDGLASIDDLQPRSISAISPVISSSGGSVSTTVQQTQPSNCPSCGIKLDFGRNVPKFCPNCMAKLR